MQGGSTRLLDPGGSKVAFYYRNADSFGAAVDLWSVSPLARTASIPLHDALRLDWLAGRDALVAIELRPEGPGARIVGTDGRTILSLERTLGVFADPATGGAYAVRYAPTVSAAEIDRIVRVYTPFNGIGDALNDGRLWFEALGPDLSGHRRLTLAEAGRALKGRPVSVYDLAPLADYLGRTYGFAGHWLHVNAGRKEDVPYSDTRRYYDLLLSPTGNASFVWRDSDGGQDVIHTLGIDGSLLYQGTAASEDVARSEYSPEGSTVAIRVTAMGRQVWHLPSIGRNAVPIVVWGR